MFNLFKKKESTQETFDSWLSQMKGAHRDDLKAVNFGLFDSGNGFRVYLIGSNLYDENDDDWACNEDFIPSEKYLSKTLETNDWKKAVSEVEYLIREFMKSDKYAGSILEKVDFITCGFDDGELKEIKTTANNG